MRLSEEEIDVEAQFIRNEELWPLWPVLPMKNMNRGDDDYPQDETHGLMIAQEFTKVWILNLCDLAPGLIRPQLEGCKCLEFESVEALVAAGWVGD